MFGLIPYAVTITGNIAVTAALAAISFIAIQLGGIKSHGAWGYFKGLIPSGMPPWILIILIPLEILGLFTKPFALCIRLFANMIAGHIVLLSLISLIFVFRSAWIGPGSVIFGIFMNFLELFVALLQAFIFTILSAMYFGEAIEESHESVEHA
jgi:F-type H+-transporting ATPase subunit a